MDNNSVGFKNLCISWDMGLFLEDPHHDWIGARHDLADLWKDHGMLMGIQPTNVDIMGICWLVVWNIFYFSIYWEFHHPNWRTHIFQRGWNHQPAIIDYIYI